MLQASVGVKGKLFTAARIQIPVRTHEQRGSDERVQRKIQPLIGIEDSCSRNDQTNSFKSEAHYHKLEASFDERKQREQ